MISLILVAMLLSPSASPLKMSFMVLTLSLYVAIGSLMSSSSIFPFSVIIMSFSTGMMILFCYCASMVNYEKKNPTKMATMMLMIPTIIIVTMEKMPEMSMSPHSTMEYQLQFLMVAIMVVVVSMLSINKSMFSPMKSSMSVY